MLFNSRIFEQVKQKTKSKIFVCFFFISFDAHTIEHKLLTRKQRQAFCFCFIFFSLNKCLWIKHSFIYSFIIFCCFFFCSMQSYQHIQLNTTDNILILLTRWNHTAFSWNRKLGNLRFYFSFSNENWFNVKVETKIIRLQAKHHTEYISCMK